jgi:Bacteriophage baseplate protein W
MSELNAIFYPFTLDDSASRLREERDYEAYIVQLIKQVLLTNLGERINRPSFGSNIRQMVFAPMATTTYTRTLVYQALERWLSNYIRTERVDVEAEESTMRISVEYTVIARGTKRFLNVELEI